VELKIAALKKGTVIDHIPTDKVFSVVSILNLENSAHQVTIANFLDSKKMGKKGLVKISEKILGENETNKLTLIAPNAQINIIDDFKVVGKRSLSLPAEISEIVQCGNPNCITNHQPVKTHFYVLNDDNSNVKLKCRYCEREMTRENAKLK